MSWKTYLAERTITPEQAAAKVASGNRVVTGHAAGSPDILINALVNRAAELRDVEIVHLVALGECRYCAPEHEGSFRYNGPYLSGGTRKAVAECRADFTPYFFHQVPELLRSPDFPVDYAFITVSLPDEDGKVSLGVAVDYTLQGALSAKTVIAVINPNMPYIKGALMDVTDIDYFVQADVPLFEIPLPKIGEVEKAIGGHIAALIKDGDCLQLGIGAIPDAVLSCLGDKKELGIHSEMISDGVMDLAEKGVITGSRKSLHPGKIVITFAMGSSKLYRWMDKNPVVESYPVDYVNDPRVIGKNDNLISINSALSVDLLGQVAADSVGTQVFSGVGGQVDFVRGVRFSNGGLSIIAMPSTASKGKISRISGVLSPGQPVTTSRYDVDHVVTEHGVAALRGKTMVQRAKALISIAAPEFREQLAREACDVYGLKV